MQKGKRKYKFNLFNTAILVNLIVYAFILFFALYWMMTAALKTDKEIVSGNFFGLPKEWLFKNYITALRVFEYQISYYER